MYCLKDSDGILRHLSFMCSQDLIKYNKKEIDRLTKDGSKIVLINIEEINN